MQTKLQTIKAMYVFSQGEHGQLQLDVMQLLVKLGHLQEALDLCQEELRECEVIEKVEEAPPVEVRPVAPQCSPEVTAAREAACHSGGHCAYRRGMGQLPGGDGPVSGWPPALGHRSPLRAMGSNMVTRKRFEVCKQMSPS